MEIEKVLLNAREILKCFINSLGYNGNYYIDMNKSPILFLNVDGISQFLCAKSIKLKKFLNKVKLVNEDYIFNEGLIVIRKKVDNNLDLNDLYQTIIHEMIHANRMLLVNSQFSNNRIVSGVLYDNNRFRLSYKNKAHYKDALQELLKAPIDDSCNQKKLSFKKKQYLSNHNYEYDNKMEEQYKIDEALVEIIAILSLKIFQEKEINIMDAIESINQEYSGDINAITNIVLRHNNLDLLKWMIDPISYEIGVVNYDYFRCYLNEDDYDDYNRLIESEDVMFDDDEYDRYVLSLRK